MPMSTIVPIAIAIPAKRHDVCSDANEMHRNEGDQNGCRQADRDNETAANVQQEQQDDDCRNQDLITQRVRQRRHRLVDQSAAIVDAVNS